MNVQVLRRVAAEIAAAAVFETFPNIVLLGGKDTSTGFFYDLYFPHIVNPETISLIEERMRQIIREKRPIKTIEMVPMSARGFLKKEGHSARAEELEDEEEGLVELIQMGSFVDLCPGPHLKNTAEVAAFKILSLEFIENRDLRITGSAHRSKDDLKVFLKKIDAYSKQNHTLLGKEKGFWNRAEEGLVWESKGLDIKRKLVAFLKKNLFGDAREVSGPFGVDRVGLHCSLAKGKAPLQLAEIWTRIAEDWDPEVGLLKGPEETQIQISTFSSPEQFSPRLISSLQSIGKTLIILGFNYSISLRGRKRLFQELEKVDWGVKMDLEEANLLQVDFLVEDGLDRLWPVVQVKGVSAKEPGAAIISASVERIFALLLEKNLLSAIEHN